MGVYGKARSARGSYCSRWTDIYRGDDELSLKHMEFKVPEEHTAASFTHRWRAQGRALGWAFAILGVWEPLEMGGRPELDKIIQTQPHESDLVPIHRCGD